MSQYLPVIAWSTIASNVTLGASAYRYYITVNPLDPNEAGASPMTVAINDWFIDFAGYPFLIENVAGSVLTVYDILERGDGVVSAYAPYANKLGYVYRPLNGAIILTQAQLRKLDASAADIIQPIEKGIVWKYRGLELNDGVVNKSNITSLELSGLTLTDNTEDGWQGGSKLALDASLVGLSDVYGTPTDQYVPKWIEANNRFEFAAVSGGSSQWTTVGSDIYYNTGKVFIGQISGTYTLDVNGTIGGTNIETNSTSLSTRLGLNALDDENEAAVRYNVAIGRSALTSITTGDYTTAVGANCGLSVSSGTANSLFGYQCGLNLTSSQNSLFGYQTGAYISSGNKHTAIGYEALKAITTTSGCIGVGFKAGVYETGGYKLFIDALDRTNEATGRTDSIIYGVMNSTASSQELYLNSKLFARHLTSATKTNCLYYDTSTKEISYGALPSGSGVPGGSSGDMQFNSSGSFEGTPYFSVGDYLDSYDVLHIKNSGGVNFYGTTGGTTAGIMLRSISTAGKLGIGLNSSGDVVEIDQNIIRLLPNTSVKLCDTANVTELYLGTSSTKIGLFGTSPVVKTSVTDPSAVVTTETADATYSTNEVNMLNNLKTDVTNLQSKLTTLINALQSYGLI